MAEVSLGVNTALTVSSGDKIRAVAKLTLGVTPITIQANTTRMKIVTKNTD